MKGVNQIIAKYTKYDIKLIRSDMHLVKDLGADSLTVYEIGTACEALFELEEIPEEEMRKVGTVQDIYDMVRAYTLAI
jgi:acyl carrier protein